jgi:hypothetical protein
MGFTRRLAAMKHVILVLILLFCGVCTASAQQWMVVKDKAGKCEIMRTRPEVMILAGPFMSKVEAEKALKESCPHSKPEQK